MTVKYFHFPGKYNVFPLVFVDGGEKMAFVAVKPNAHFLQNYFYDNQEKKTDYLFHETNEKTRWIRVKGNFSEAIAVCYMHMYGIYRCMGELCI